MLNVLSVANNASESEAVWHNSREASHTLTREGVSLPTRHRFSSAARRARASCNAEEEDPPAERSC